MNFELVDEQGKRIAMGRDLAALQKEHGAQARQSFARQSLPEYERERVTYWPSATSRNRWSSSATG